MNIDLNRFQARLQEDLKAVNAAIQQAAEAATTVELDQSRVGRLSRMDAMQQQAMAKEVQTRMVNRKRKLEAALARIPAGNYGACCECRDPLDIERLEADPATVFCGDCASEREAR